MNTVILKGRLTREPEIKTTNNNTVVANINVAVQRDFKNQAGEYEADFFNCSAFGNTAELLEKYFHKGQEILLTGKIQNRNWETETGEKKYATDIIINKVEFCGSKSNDNNKEEVNINVANDKADDNLPF